MKILHIIFQMLTGGAETMLADIVNEQILNGNEVEILIVNRGENDVVMKTISPSVKVSRFNRTPGAAPLLLMARLNLFVLRRRPDVVHLHMHKLTGLLKVMKGRTLFTVHALDIPMIYAADSNMAAISEAVAANVKARVPNAKIRVVSNGIDTSAIKVRGDRKPAERVRIVQVSRLIAEIKGQDILIKAIAQLVGRGYDVECTFIGEGTDLEMLKELAGREGVPDRVNFTGNLPRKEIYRRLAEFDLMCHPSRFEGFGLTVAEGMAAGLPLVVPEGGGPWEVADKGRLAETFVNDDPTTCAKAIAHVIDHYPACLRRAAEAREYVEDNFSVKRMVKQYADIYRDMVDGKF